MQTLLICRISALPAYSQAYNKENAYDHIIIYPGILSLPDLYPSVLCRRRKRRRFTGSFRPGADGIYTGVEKGTLQAAMIKLLLLCPILLLFIQSPDWIKLHISMASDKFLHYIAVISYCLSF